MTYTIYRAPGWHGKPHDPVVATTDDRRRAAMLAGERIDIHMPGGSNRYDCYALDEHGREVARIESYRCDQCNELVEWGDDGPAGGAAEGRVLECPEGYPSHLVTWLCDDCLAQYEDAEEDAEDDA